MNSTLLIMLLAITGPLEVFTRHRRIQLIIDLCDGGDLYARRPYTELAAGLICKQVLRYTLKHHNEITILKALSHPHIVRKVS
jgi:hypothetical protein